MVRKDDGNTVEARMGLTFGMCRKGIQSQGKAKVPVRKLIFAILFFS